MKNIKLTELRVSGGCQAKIDSKKISSILKNVPTVTNEKLLVGYGDSDDAGIFCLNNDLALVQTIDFFPPIVDDPYLFGQIAAANALSDVYAMGGVPITAMNIVCFPDDLDPKILTEILCGGASKVKESGAVICGGHSIKDKEPKYGLSVTGIVDPKKIFVNNALNKGDHLLLLKPLGTGMIVSSFLENKCSASIFQEAVDSMCLLNKKAMEVLTQFSTKCVTDVTGFGLLGHLSEILEASRLSAVIHMNDIPLFKGLYELLETIEFSCAVGKNKANNQDHVFFANQKNILNDILYEPQTSGGFLVALPPQEAKAALSQLKDFYPYSSIIGEVVELSDKLIKVE